MNPKSFKIETMKLQGVYPMEYITTWERDGEIKGMARVLLNQIKDRFGDAPSWVQDKLQNADAGTLDRWSRLVYRKDRLEEVFN
jgi:hypothetical protein